MTNHNFRIFFSQLSVLMETVLSKWLLDEWACPLIAQIKSHKTHFWSSQLKTLRGYHILSYYSSIYQIDNEVPPYFTYQVCCFANDKPKLGVTDVVDSHGPSHDDNTACRVFDDQWRHKMRKWSDFNPFAIANILTNGLFFRVHPGTRTTLAYLTQRRGGQLELGGGLQGKHHSKIEWGKFILIGLSNLGLISGFGEVI